MPFESGQSGNPAGRPPGAKDAKGRAAKAIALSFVRQYFDTGQAKRDWTKMKPGERWAVICRLLAIVTPRDQRISLAGLQPGEAARIVLEAAGMLSNEEEE